MKIIFLLVFFTLLSVAYPRHKRRHRKEELKEKLWRRHGSGKEDEGDKQKRLEFDPNTDINVTRIYDHVSKFGKSLYKTENALKRSPYLSSQPGVWQFNTAGGDQLKLLVSDISKKTADIVNGVRRSDCISSSGCTPEMGDVHSQTKHFSQEMFLPGDEKTFSEPMSFLQRNDRGPFHHFENHGQPIVGGLARGASVVTHQMNLESPPSNVYMHGIEKTQP